MPAKMQHPSPRAARHVHKALPGNRKEKVGQQSAFEGNNGI
jgi:hypothetical protein